jgi:hypothetical protein
MSYLTAQKDLLVSELGENIFDGCLQLTTWRGEDEFDLQDFTEIQSKLLNLFLCEG